jgi:hypothetical protein
MTSKTTADDFKATITVYRDHPKWDEHSRWFMMPTWLLNDLYVCTYDCNWDLPSPTEIKYVEKEHPGHVYVY